MHIKTVLQIMRCMISRCNLARMVEVLHKLVLVIRMCTLLDNKLCTLLRAKTAKIRKALLGYYYTHIMLCRIDV